MTGSHQLHLLFASFNKLGGVMKKLKINRVLETLNRHYPRTVILFGGPGIGKSEQVHEFAEQKAKEMGLKYLEWDDSLSDGEIKNSFILLDIRLYEVTQEDFFIPRENDGKLQFKYNRPLHALSKCPGVLFLDEISNTLRPDVQSILFKLLLDKRVGWLKLHPDVMVVGAGNPPEYSDVATELATPIMNRAAVYEVEPATVKEWISYESTKERTNPNVIAYLMKFPEDFYKPPDSGTAVEPYPTPRSWTMLSEFLNKNEKYYEEDCQAFLGGEVGSKFYQFIKVTRNFPDIEECIKNKKYPGDKLKTMDIKYLFFTHLAHYLLKNFPEKYKKIEEVIFIPALSEDREMVMLTLSLFFRMLPVKKRREIYEEMLKMIDTSLKELIKDLGTKVAKFKKEW